MSEAGLLLTQGRNVTYIQETGWEAWHLLPALVEVVSVYLRGRPPGEWLASVREALEGEGFDDYLESSEKFGFDFYSANSGIGILVVDGRPICELSALMKSTELQAALVIQPEADGQAEDPRMYSGRVVFVLVPNKSPAVA